MKFTVEEKSFKKAFKKLDKKIREAFSQQIEIFEKDRTDSRLKDHPLVGDSKGYRSFSVTGNFRVVYYVKGEAPDQTAVLLNIDTHPDIYDVNYRRRYGKRIVLQIST